MDVFDQFHALADAVGPTWRDAGGTEPGVTKLQNLMACAQTVEPYLLNSGSHGGLSAAVDLVRFFAAFPERLVDDVEEIACLPGPAWRYADRVCWKAVEELVHDVWCHCFGPESEVDTKILDVLSQYVTGSVCDLGAGAGVFAAAMADRGRRVTCVEANPVKAAFLRERARLRGLEEGLRVGTLRGHFDAVLAVNVLDHMDAPPDTVRLIGECLKPGGVLVCWAAFADDGVHRSGADLIDDVFAALSEQFAFIDLPECHGTPLSIFRKGDEELDRQYVELDDDALSARTPVVFSDLDRRDSQSLSSRAVIGSAKFYVTPMTVSESIESLLALCREERSVAFIVARLVDDGYNADEVMGHIRFLWRHRILAMRH